MTTEQYSIGYEEGYQAGWNAAMDAKPAQPQEACPTCGKYEPKTGTCGTSPNDKRALCNRNAPQAQQEPVAWMWRCKPYCNWPEWSVSLQRPADSGCDGNKRTEGYEDIPLYNAPQPQRQPQQEPVAWCDLNSGGSIAYFDNRPCIMPGAVGNESHPYPLYTSPPAQRTWVGLTLEDMETTHWSPDFRAGTKWAAAKLKEKNA